MKMVYSLVAVSLMISPVSFASEGWLTNMEEAEKKAVAENKGLLIEFTGSDWCGPCKHFKETVLSKGEFLDAVDKGFVLVELDYPRKKEQAPEQKAQNRQYAGAYGVRSYPTVIFTNAEGKPVQRLRVRRTLPNVLRAVEEAHNDRVEVDKALSELGKTTGEGRGALIKVVFDKVPFEFIDGFYGDLVNEVETLPGDPTGYKAKRNEKKANDEYRNMLKAMPGNIRGNGEKTNAFLEEEAGRAGVAPMLRQRLLDNLADNLLDMMKIDEAVAQYAAAVASSPDTGYAVEIKAKKERIERNIGNLKLTADQINDFNHYEKSLVARVGNDPGKYAEALESYLDGKKLTDGTLERIVQPMVYAMIADGKADEALVRLQKVIDGMTGGEEPSAKQNMVMFKQLVATNREMLQKRLKQSWKKMSEKR